MLQRLHAFLVSPELAIALLVIVLVCCLLGVTLLRAHASERIFGSLWFNALLVLLALSSGSAFFTRIWKRKLTVVSVGMILFHLSFVALLGGIVYNRLFYFRGALRLTEGETLTNHRPDSWDAVEQGRFFDIGRLRGETTLVKMHVDYQVGGENKRAAYEIAVGEGISPPRHVIYVTEYLDADGLRYFCSKEGYSVLVVLSGKDGREVYGAHVPLQSYPLKDGTFRYATGSATGDVFFSFPPPPEHPRGEVHLEYRPSTLKQREGEVTFRVLPFGPEGSEPVERTGRVLVGGVFDAGEFTLSPREIRYWVGMDVRYDPGVRIILGSLVAGLTGMLLILVGRIRQGARRRPEPVRQVREEIA